MDFSSERGIWFYLTQNISTLVVNMVRSRLCNRLRAEYPSLELLRQKNCLNGFPSQIFQVHGLLKLFSGYSKLPTHELSAQFGHSLDYDLDHALNSRWIGYEEISRKWLGGFV